MEKKVEKDKEDFEYNSSSILGLIYDKVQSFKAEKLQSASKQFALISKFHKR